MLELPGLHDPQQLGLQLQGQVADLVEEEGRAVGEFEPAQPRLVGAGEGPPVSPEELALDQVAGERAQLTVTSGRSLRPLCAWMAAAARFLPVPVSP